MGKRFLENDVYTEYKHGLRLMAAKSGFQIAAGSDNINETIARKGSAHVYLEELEYDRDGSDVYHNLKRVTKSFNYDLYYRLAVVNYHLIDHMFMVLQQQLQKDGTMMNVMLFDGLDVDEVFEERIDGKFTLKRSYPSGKRVYTIS